MAVIKCIGCEKKPEEIFEYAFAAKQMKITPDEYVIKEEGTYNMFQPNKFYCTSCYSRWSPTILKREGVEKSPPFSKYKEGNMDTIVKTFWGKHLDLARVVGISDAYFINKMGSGGYFVGFDIDIQLMDNPMHLRFPFLEEEYTWHRGISPGHGYHEIFYVEGTKTPVAVKRIQDKLDILVEQWKQVTREMHNR